MNDVMLVTTVLDLTDHFELKHGGWQRLWLSHAWALAERRSVWRWRSRVVAPKSIAAAAGKVGAS